MFTRILVPLDGSPIAERALPVAARIASATNATVILFTAFMPQQRTAYGPSLAPYTALNSLEQEIRIKHERCATYLAGVTREPALAAVSLETAVVEGAAAPAILDATRHLGVDLVVMCSHGRTGVARWTLGSVAHRVARHSPVPVLVLRPQGQTLVSEERWAARTAEHARRLVQFLVPLDGSPLAETALAPAAQTLLTLKDSGEAARVALHLAVIVPVDETTHTYAPDLLAREVARSYLERTATRLRREYPAIEVSSSVTPAADVAHALVHLAAGGATGASAFDAIAMATHGRTGLTRWATGSTTERVLDAAHIPLMIVRPEPFAGRATNGPQEGQAFGATDVTPQPTK